jgi:altronate dehydratase
MIAGYPRTHGAAGARNHLLVLPAVVCATQVARALTGPGVVTIVHQHGCLHVGDDLSHTAATLEGVAVNPNVAGVLVVSLGCETLQGRRLAERISAAGQLAELVGVQSSGGSAAAIERGQEVLGRLREATASTTRRPVARGDFVIGVDGDGPVAAASEREAAARGFAVVRPAPGSGTGGHTHPALAAAGAVVIVAVLDTGAAPLSFAICPVVNVATDAETAESLCDDIDVDGSAAAAGVTATAAVDCAIAALGGEATATERTGAADFVLRRLAVTM